MIRIKRLNFYGIGNVIRRILMIFRLIHKPEDYLEFPYNAVLKNVQEYNDAVRKVNYLGLPRHPDKPKNWDSTAALAIILKFCKNKSSAILDAGGENYSSILTQLKYCGYKNLTCLNLSYYRKKKQRHIVFEIGDITKTRYENDHFDAITCLSVIEHGVDIKDYFREMHRILKQNGILFTSTDYWCTSIDTRNKKAFDAPVVIFNSDDIIKMVEDAGHFGFELLGPLDLNCSEKAVRWDEFNLDYTFIYFTLKKK
jgi:SAM-dependent methyltransferase